MPDNDGCDINPDVLHPERVDPEQWPFAHRHDLDDLCGTHQLRSAARRFAAALKYEDDPTRAPRELRHLVELRGKAREAFRRAFGKMCPFWLATEFLWSLVRQLPERVRGAVRRVTNKPKTPYYRPF